MMPLRVHLAIYEFGRIRVSAEYLLGCPRVQTACVLCLSSHIEVITRAPPSFTPICHWPGSSISLPRTTILSGLLVIPITSFCD